MEPLSHYHYEIYYCKPVPINLHQTTYNNLYHKTYNHSIPITSKQHVPVHQPCTKRVQITYHNNLSKQPITTICLINLINQIISTHQDQSPRKLLTICTISPRCASTKHITTTHNHHQDQYVILIIYQDKYATSSINHVSTILLASASNHVPSMYQSCIKFSSTMTHQYIPTSSTIHLMYVPTHTLIV
jgi:hypothetical protein